MHHPKPSCSCLVQRCAWAVLLWLTTGSAAIAGDGFSTTTAGKPGTGGVVPVLSGSGPLIVGSPIDSAVHISDALPNSLTTFVAGLTELAAPFYGGVFGPAPDILLRRLAINVQGALTLPFEVPESFPPGFEFFVQAWVYDSGALFGLSATNTLRVTVQASPPSSSLFAGTRLELGGPPYGPEPKDLASADLDLDGLPDLVVACFQTDRVGVFLGTEGGGFGQVQYLGTGVGPHAVALGDLDADGIPDLVVGHRVDDSISVRLGLGDGSFASAQEFPGVNSPERLLIADMDQDGDPDVVVAAKSSGTALYLGDGAGGLAAAQSLDSIQATDVAVGDFNDDGVLDLVVVNHLNWELSVFLGAGGGLFDPAVRYPTGVSPWSVAIADFDLDGALDLVAANRRLNGRVSVLFGAGDGSFGNMLSRAAGSRTQDVGAGDVNGDGAPDIVASNWSSDDVSILLGGGDGNFSAQQLLPAGAQPAGLLLTDFDLDGRLDIASCHDVSDDIAVYLTAGSPKLGNITTLPTSVTPSAIVAVDLDNDQRLDLVVSGFGPLVAPAELTVHLGLPGGGFAAAQVHVIEKSPTSIGVGDFNSDQVIDIAVSGTFQNEVSILLGMGNGDFFPQQRFPMGDDPMALVVADFDGDGVSDVATANRLSDDVTVRRGNGLGGLGPSQSFAAGDRPQELACADLDGDGELDLIVGTGGEEVLLLRGVGDASFQPAELIFTSPASVIGLELADLDGDGLLDLATSFWELAGGQLVVHLGNGDGSFAPGQFIPLDDNPPESLQVADFNLDGVPDVATLAAVSWGPASVLLGVGDGSFQPAARFALGVSPRSLVAADLDGDGAPDLAACSAAPNDAVILLTNRALD